MNTENDDRMNEGLWMQEQDHREQDKINEVYDELKLICDKDYLDNWELSHIEDINTVKFLCLDTIDFKEPLVSIVDIEVLEYGNPYKGLGDTYWLYNFPELPELGLLKVTFLSGRTKEYVFPAQIAEIAFVELTNKWKGIE